MPSDLPDRRLLLVHAHPDDESITNGATMARYAAEGAQITLITCTRGEQGEMIPPALSHLTAGAGGTLGAHRELELAAAMNALGVTDHRFLGDPLGDEASCVFVDSGMALDHEGMVVPMPDPPEAAFTVVDAEVEAEVLAQVLRSVRPHVVITYEPGGGYGHPDHVRAHVVTMRALELAAITGPGGEPAWRVPKVYWIVLPLTLMRAALQQMALASNRPSGLDPDGRLPSVMVPDEQVTTAIDATAWTASKVAALRAHETQVAVTQDDAFFALSNGFFQPIMGLEFFRLVHGNVSGPFDDLGRETDLFAGIS